MDNQQNTFFFETQQISDNILFEEFKKQKIFFSYFKVDQKYYLFLYAQRPIDINSIYQSVDIIQELDTRQRKLRSFRGFLLYALEIMETGKDFEILSTNLQPFFWKKVRAIIKQNQKTALLRFLFRSEPIDGDTVAEIQSLKETMKALQNQVNSLQQKVIDLESERSE